MASSRPEWLPLTVVGVSKQSGFMLSAISRSTRGDHGGASIYPYACLKLPAEPALWSARPQPRPCACSFSQAYVITLITALPPSDPPSLSGCCGGTPKIHESCLLARPPSRMVHTLTAILPPNLASPSHLPYLALSASCPFMPLYPSSYRMVVRTLGN